jgi:SAM-dependent methyltransferase
MSSPKQVQSESVVRFRAVRTVGYTLDDDPEPMVQQQLARLYFFDRMVGSTACNVLDWGCGTGYNCSWLKAKGKAKEVVGFDISEDSIILARQTVPDATFVVASACDPNLDLQQGHWDRIISCEVLEHVPDMTSFLANIRRHLASNGIAYITTPNRILFSMGHEPSPLNKDHIKELDLNEFTSLLQQHFSDFTIYGQQFKEEHKLQEWAANVNNLIKKMQAGKRWEPSSRSKIKKIWIVEKFYQMNFLRGVWKFLRWQLIPAIGAKINPETPPYMQNDFEFVTGDLSKSVWFCAIIRG